MENVVIIGSGCAGLTAAIYCARADLHPVVIEGSQPGGQLTTTSLIENFPGFPDGIGGFELVNNMKQQAEKFGTKFLSEEVIFIDFSLKTKKLTTATGTMEAKAIIVATGAAPRFLNIPGEKNFCNGKGLSTCATCDGAFFKNKIVAVIGGGDSACEEALFLTHFCQKVYIVHRRDQLRASKIMSEKVMTNNKIEILWNSVPVEMLGNEKLSGLKLVTSGQKNILNCDGVFLAIGHTPNTKIFAHWLDQSEEGYILTSYSQTNISGVFAAGDCADPKFRQAVTAAGLGCSAAMEAERYIVSKC
ncbi:MAG: thioredoxin-disulfide reductase [Puniceicoccales bacterium]|jgi:thioredoxin reductase (NADPH)|nr:thioredoxin-disulfide reductase [Puniceicoccales bacterium]